MKSVSGKIVSSKPISLSKASNILSKFVSFENGASQPVSVYLRRTSAAFTELTRFHKELKPSRSHRKYRFKNYNSIVQIPEEDGVEHFEDGSKSNKISKKENPVRKEGEIDGERDGKRDKKKKSESVETESRSSLGVELVKMKEKKKRKGGEIDDEVAFDSGEKKKKKRRRIEGDLLDS